MALIGKQVRHLRSLAHHLEPVVFIGKADVNEAVVTQANEALEARELIKCSVQDGYLLSTRDAATDLASKTNSEVVRAAAGNHDGDAPGVEGRRARLLVAANGAARDHRDPALGRDAPRHPRAGEPIGRRLPGAND